MMLMQSPSLTVCSKVIPRRNETTARYFKSAYQEPNSSELQATKSLHLQWLLMKAEGSHPSTGTGPHRDRCNITAYNSCSFFTNSLILRQQQLLKTQGRVWADEAKVHLTTELRKAHLHFSATKWKDKRPLKLLKNSRGLLTKHKSIIPPRWN